jgi:hypothetical protein
MVTFPGKLGDIWLGVASISKDPMDGICKFLVVKVLINYLFYLTTFFVKPFLLISFFLC